MNKEQALQTAKDLCKKHGHKLLYLTQHGSHLYGTNTETSDTDYKGIMLPDIKVLVMGNRVDGLKKNTKEDPSVKNTQDDCDLELYSVQFWLKKLVKNGETEGIELLYSYTNRDAVVYCDPVMEDIFFYKTKLFDPRNAEAFIGFALNQARKYFVKAERFGVIRDIWIDLKDMGPLRDGLRLIDVMDDILNTHGHPTYCFEPEMVNSIRSIQVCGKIHQGTISLGEFFTRLTREYEKYGHRTRAADLNGTDWKSLSHALKAIFEVRSLLTDQHIDFPFSEPQRSLLLSIKKGEIPFDVVEKYIMDGIDEVDRYNQQFSDINWKHDPEYVWNAVAKLYNL